MNACQTCGNAVTVDFRAKLTRCDGCKRGPRFCSCQPQAAVPTWLQRAREGHGVAKDLTGQAA